MIHYKMFVILCLQFCLVFAQTSELPSFVHVCKRNIPDLNECLKTASLDLCPYLAKGIPEMGLIPIDPVKIPNFSAKIRQASINLDLEITDATIYNLSKFTFSELDAQPLIGRVTTNFLLDNVDIEGNYVLKGNVSTFAINGKGLFTFNSTDVSVNADWFGNTVIKNEEEYMKFTKLTTKINIKNLQLYAYDLFEGNDELTQTVNKIINDNIQELKNDFDHVLEELVGKIALEYVSGVYDNFPLSVLFPFD